MTNLPDANDLYSPIESPASHLTRQIYRGWIAIFHTTSLSRDNVDAWYNAVDSWYQNVELRPNPAERIGLVLHDFSNLETPITPYSNARAKDLAVRHATLPGRVAVIVSTSYFRLLTELTIRAMEGKIERRLFQSMKAGLSWLEELLPVTNK